MVSTDLWVLGQVSLVNASGTNVGQSDALSGFSAFEGLVLKHS